MSNVNQADFSDFVKSFGFILFFLVMVLGFALILGDGPTVAFLWLVLISMVLLNVEEIKSLLGRYSTV